MGSTLLRNIVLALALIIFSFVVGIVAADSAQEAAVWLFAVIGILVFIAAGKKIWMGIFLVTPFCAFMPSVAGFPSSQLLIIAIFFYWLILAMLGHVKLEWKKLISLDILVFLFVAYMAFSFYRNPVSVAILRDFGIESDNVGGDEYYVLLSSLLVYIAISMISFPRSVLPRILKWNLVLIIAITLFIALKGAIIGGGTLGATESDTLADEFQNTRFSYFSSLGIIITTLVYGSIPYRNVIFSLKHLALLFVGFLSVLISGWRSTFVIYGASVLGCAIIKRELSVLLFCGCIMYGGIWYMSERGVVKELPFGAQRVLSMCPGIEVESHIKRDAEGSSDWRIQLWKWALDPRTGYIKDYLLGDGPGQSLSAMLRSHRAYYRGELRESQTQFAVQKQWHSGFITNLSYIGIVGSIIMFVTQIWSVLLAFVVCNSMKNNHYYIYSLLLFVYFFRNIFVYYISTGTINVFSGTFISMAYLKMYYNIALEDGRLQPWRWRKRYVPIMAKKIGAS